MTPVVGDYVYIDEGDSVGQQDFRGHILALDGTVATIRNLAGSFKVDLAQCGYVEVLPDSERPEGLPRLEAK